MPSVPHRLLCAFFIRKILEVRFSLTALQQWKDNDPQWWHSSANYVGRGLYGEALRERERLAAAPHEQLVAELAAVGAWKAGAPASQELRMNE